MNYFDVGISIKNHRFNNDKSIMDLTRGTIRSQTIYQLEYTRSITSYKNLFLREDYDLEKAEGLEPLQVKADILRFYKSMGYSDIKVQNNVKLSQDGLTQFNQFMIDLGPKYTVKYISFDGNKHLSRNEILGLIGISSWRNSIVLDRDTIDAAIDRVRSSYLVSGFLDVEITKLRIKKDEENNSARLSFRIRENLQHG